MKKGLSLFVASAMIVGNVGSSISISYADENDVSRISGKDRFETCAVLSKKAFTKSDIAIITSGESYPDALSSGSFATRYNAPLLLVKKDHMPEVISNELKRLGVKEVKIIGGEDTISKALFDEISKNYKAERISGVDRFETSIKVADNINKIKGNTSGDIFVNGNVFPDALVATSLASKLNKNVILTDGKNISSSYRKAESSSKEGDLIVGGKNSINIPSVKAQQIGGKDRYDTALKVSQKYFPDTKKVILANGEEYIDSLSSSNLLGKENIPILLNEKNNLKKDVENYIKNNKISNITLVGGTQTLSSYIENSVKNILDGFSKAVSSSSKPIASIPGKPSQPSKPSNPSNPSEPGKPSNPEAGKLKYKNGTYRGIGGGFYDTDADRRMEVQITIKDDKITDFELLKFGDDNSFEDSYRNFEKKFLPKMKSDIGEVSKIYNSIVNWLNRKPADYIDVATGATYSNKGVTLAILDALKQAENTNLGQHAANKVKDLFFTKQPKSAVLYFGDNLSLNEFEITIRYWDSSAEDTVVKMNELEKYGIEVNIPEGTAISSKNLKMNEDGFFDVVFKHKESKKEISAKFQVKKKIVYVRPLKEIEIEFKDGTNKKLNADNENEFNYKLEVSEDEYSKGIKEIKAKDSKGDPIEVKKFTYENGICYITLKNNVVERESVKEKDRRFDNFNIELIKKEIKEDKTDIEEGEADEDEEENDEIKFHNGVYTSKKPGYNSIKKLEEQKDNQLTLTVEDGKIKKIDFEYNDTNNELFKNPLEQNKEKLSEYIKRDEFNYFESEDLFDKIIEICNNNIDIEEKKGQGKVKKDFKEVREIDVTTGATYSTKSLFEAIKDVLEQALQGKN
ncbi:cell wall-binding repeat-containing protein [Peptostreptococcus sp. D1]|uniref:cell wall-binding repeat-containing protein n=1 Tax=Peptostreptococcus sp. D1 TaxID=72304 RepID=UPI0008EA64A6|nr:cell wall-binding repeat-containing protein [Peptostreptococcus sp. D1]SFE95373.1 Putative cell wall-binding protein [Peptostreptococcus sp. D1]